MRYRAKIERDGDGFLLTFPSVPEAITGGETEAEAIANAEEALSLALLTYAADGRPLPTDRRSGSASYGIVVPATVAAKLAFIEAFRGSGLTRVALAATLGKAENEVRRMLDPYHQTKLGAIEAGLRALGKRIVLSVEEAA